LVTNHLLQRLLYQVIKGKSMKVYYTQLIRRKLYKILTLKVDL